MTGKGAVIAYYRLSVEDHEVKTESNSITNQRLLIQNYLSAHGELNSYDFFEFYDDGYSGSNMERPGIQQVLDKVKKNEVNCIIVKDFSRFSRDYIELGTYLEQIFPFMRIRFISVTDHYDSNDHKGKTLDIAVEFKSLLADFYCKDISDKVKTSLSTKREQGKYSTGLTPFGYVKNPENKYELQIVLEEAEVIRQIFDYCIKGHNTTEICRKLNDEHVPTAREFKRLRKQNGQKTEMNEKYLWSARPVYQILTNQFYIGNMVYGKSSQEIGSGRFIYHPREEWKVYENHHEPIIDKKIFEEVQEKFLKRPSVVREKVEHLLKGKVYCGGCGKKMQIVPWANGKGGYHCPNSKYISENHCFGGSMEKERLEKIVMESIVRQMNALIDFDVVLNEVIEKGRDSIESDRQMLRKRMAEQEELMGERTKILEAYHDSEITKEVYAEERNRLNEERNDCTGQIEQLQADIVRKESSLMEKKEQNDELLKFVGFENLNQEMVDSFVKEIYLFQDKRIELCWMFNETKEIVV